MMPTKIKINLLINLSRDRDSSKKNQWIILWLISIKPIEKDNTIVLKARWNVDNWIIQRSTWMKMRKMRCAHKSYRVLSRKEKNHGGRNQCTRTHMPISWSICPPEEFVHFSALTNAVATIGCCDRENRIFVSFRSFNSIISLSLFLSLVIFFLRLSYFSVLLMLLLLLWFRFEFVLHASNDDGVSFSLLPPLKIGICTYTKM